MTKTVLIQLTQKEFEAVIFKAVCQAIKLNSPISKELTGSEKKGKVREVKK